MNQFCHQCGSPVSPGARFCPKCGAGVQPATVSEPANPPIQAPPARPAGVKALMIDAFQRTKASLADYFEHPKKLIPMLVLAAVWLLLSLLPAFGINPWPVKLLSFLTFAQGGMYGGFWGVVGGVIGKAVVAYFVSTLLLPLLKGKNPLKGMGDGFKRFFSGMAVKSAAAGAQLMLGIGLALIVFNFLTGNASAVNSLVGVIGFVLAIRALFTSGGFFWSLMLSVAHRLSGGRIPSQMAIGRVMSGYAAGSALSVALAAVLPPYRLFSAYLPYAAGGILILVGVILLVTSKTGKGAAIV